ncbi:hypothetical protein TcWFU_000288 [Taenia crassiceps]|uniref:Ubiquinol-cytochrome C reductase hinge domain-containing protein n=1 Tax=Taenia crassiceps TaxID=6207 RepID=A0ABR4Q578_9CEST
MLDCLKALMSNWKAFQWGQSEPAFSPPHQTPGFGNDQTNVINWYLSMSRSRPPSSASLNADRSTIRRIDRHRSIRRCSSVLHRATQPTDRHAYGRTLCASCALAINRSGGVGEEHLYLPGVPGLMSASDTVIDPILRQQCRETKGCAKFVKLFEACSDRQPNTKESCEEEFIDLIQCVDKTVVTLGRTSRHVKCTPVTGRFESRLRPIVNKNADHPPLIAQFTLTRAAPFKDQKFHRPPSQSIGSNYSPGAARLQLNRLPPRSQLSEFTGISKIKRIRNGANNSCETEADRPRSPLSQINEMKTREEQLRRLTGKPSDRDIALFFPVTPDVADGLLNKRKRIGLEFY